MVKCMHETLESYYDVWPKYEELAIPDNPGCYLILEKDDDDKLAYLAQPADNNGHYLVKLQVWG